MLVTVNVDDEAIDHACVDGTYCKACPISYSLAKMLRADYSCAVTNYETLIIGKTYVDYRNGELCIDYDEEHDHIRIPYVAEKWQRDNSRWAPNGPFKRPEPFSFELNIPGEYLNEC